MTKPAKSDSPENEARFYHNGIEIDAFVQLIIPVSPHRVGSDGGWWGEQEDLEGQVGHYAAGAEPTAV